MSGRFGRGLFWDFPLLLMFRRFWVEGKQKAEPAPLTQPSLTPSLLL